MHIYIFLRMIHIIALENRRVTVAGDISSKSSVLQRVAVRRSKLQCGASVLQCDATFMSRWQETCAATAVSCSELQ